MKQILYFITFLCCCTATTAQNKKDSLIHRDLLLEKEYTPTVETAGKIYQDPGIENTDIKKVKTEFDISAIPANTSNEYVPLRAAETIITYPAEKEQGYVRIGFGNHLSFLEDAQWTPVKTQKNVLDLSLQSRSHFGKVNLYDDSKKAAKNTDTRLQLHYTLHLNTAEFQAGISERYHRWNYYGQQNTENATITNTDSIGLPDMQWSSTTAIHTQLKSKPWDKNFNYDIQMDGFLFCLGHGLSHESSARENLWEKEMDLSAVLDYHYNENITLELNCKEKLFGEPDLSSSDQVSRTDHITTAFAFGSYENILKNGNWTEISPEIKFKWGDYFFTAGGRISSFSTTNKVRFSPIASVSGTFNDQTNFEIRIDGGEKVYSYREGFDINPYIDPAVRLLPEYTPFGIQGRILWKPFRQLSLSPFCGFALTKDICLFSNAFPTTSSVLKIQSESFSKVFMADYADNDLFYAGIDLSYHYQKTFSLNATFRYNHYNLYSDNTAFDEILDENREKAWYRPSILMNCNFEYSPTEKLNIFARYALEASRYASTYQNYFEKLEDIHNVSVGASYAVTQDIDVFLHLYNLCNQSYEIYSGYPSYGLTGLIGISYSF